jgi:hypothetical protein
MPPWFADSRSTLKFSNDRRLTQREIDTIAWVDGGGLSGNEADLRQCPGMRPAECVNLTRRSDAD